MNVKICMYIYIWSLLYLKLSYFHIHNSPSRNCCSIFTPIGTAKFDKNPLLSISHVKIFRFYFLWSVCMTFLKMSVCLDVSSTQHSSLSWTHRPKIIKMQSEYAYGRSMLISKSYFCQFVGDPFLLNKLLIIFRATRTISNNQSIPFRHIILNLV